MRQPYLLQSVVTGVVDAQRVDRPLVRVVAAGGLGARECVQENAAAGGNEIHLNLTQCII